VAAAAAFERAAGELEDAIVRERDELLSLPQAAIESGYSRDNLARQIRAGTLPNAGRRHAPRIRRGDLPRKSGRLTAAPNLPISRTQIARSVVHSDKGDNDG
jgi:hypothetical protein